MKKIYFILPAILFFAVSSTAHAQLAGDNCANAILLDATTGSCSSAGYTNVGYTSVGDPVPTCWASAPDNSVWFKFVADSSQVTVNTNFTTTAGTYITDTEIALFS